MRFKTGVHRRSTNGLAWRHRPYQCAVLSLPWSRLATSRIGRPVLLRMATDCHWVSTPYTVLGRNEIRENPGEPPCSASSRSRPGLYLKDLVLRLTITVHPVRTPPTPHFTTTRCCLMEERRFGMRDHINTQGMGHASVFDTHVTAKYVGRAE